MLPCASSLATPALRTSRRPFLPHKDANFYFPCVTVNVTVGAEHRPERTSLPSRTFAPASSSFRGLREGERGEHANQEERQVAGVCPSLWCSTTCFVVECSRGGEGSFSEGGSTDAFFCLRVNRSFSRSSLRRDDSTTSRSRSCFQSRFSFRLGCAGCASSWLRLW